MLIYWSKAIKHWFPDFPRIPRDTDYIVKDINNYKNNYSNKEDIKEYYWTNAFEYLLKHNKDKKYVDPDLLYTIKLSHLSYNINWWKHLKDVLFLKQKWCKVVEEFYYLLMEDWKIIHWKKKVKLNVKNEDFFKWNIYRRFEHDFLHSQYALHWEPMNFKIREDLSSPKCSKELWNKLSHQEKIDCVVEELYVLTTERYLFTKKPSPYINKLDYAKKEMLFTMITSTTSGWFNLFIKDNIEEIIDYKPKLILDKIEELLKIVEEDWKKSSL